MGTIEPPRTPKAEDLRPKQLEAPGLRVRKKLHGLLERKTCKWRSEMKSGTRGLKFKMGREGRVMNVVKMHYNNCGSLELMAHFHPTKISRMHVPGPDLG